MSRKSAFLISLGQKIGMSLKSLLEGTIYYVLTLKYFSLLMHYAKYGSVQEKILH